MIVIILSALLDILVLILKCSVVLYADLWMIYVLNTFVAALMEGDNDAQGGK